MFRFAATENASWF